MRVTGARLILAVLLGALLGVASIAAEIEITGRVTGAVGAPLAEADVLLLPLLDPAARGALALEGWDLPEIADQARTGADGRFRLAAPRAGLWVVRVEAEGYVPVERRLVPLVERTGLPAARLVRDEGLLLRVLDASGQPMPGALVLSRPSHPRRGPRFRLPGWRSAAVMEGTDETGTVFLPLAAGETLSVSASAPGRPATHRGGVSDSEVTLRLPEPGLPLEVLVTDAEGRPADGVLLLDPEAVHPLTLTAADGRARLDLTAGKESGIVALAADGRRLERRLSPPPPEEENAEDATLALPEATIARGRVIASDDRRALAEAIVWTADERWVRADGKGAFVLALSGGGPYDLRASAAGSLPGGLREVDSLSAARGVTLALDPGATIEGVVVDAQGEPVEDAELTVLPGLPRMRGRRMGRGAPVLPRSLSGERGAFHIAAVPPGAGQTLSARAEGHAPASLGLPVLEPRKLHEGLRVVLRRGASVGGVVTDAEDRPLADAGVTLSPVPAGFPPGREEMARLVSSFLDENARLAPVLTDQEGRFSLSELAPGRYALTATHKGFAATTLSGLDLEESGEPLDLGRIRLEPGTPLPGIVTDSEGLPIEGASIFLLSGFPGGGPGRGFGGRGGPGGAMEARFRLAGREPDATTATDGGFLLEDLRAGESVDLWIEREGFLSDRAGNIPVPSPEPVRLSLAPASAVEGEVIDPEEAPVPGARVSVSTTRVVGGRVLRERGGQEARSDGEGRFRVEEVAPGPVTLRVEASGWQEAELSGIEVPWGEDLRGLKVALEPEAILEGRVLDAEGRPVIGARVSPVEGGVGAGGGGPFFGGGGGEARSDGDGRYRLTGLPPGPLSVEAVDAEGARVARDTEIEAGANTLDLRFPPGQEVSGRVVDAEGLPVPGARVSLSPGAAARQGLETSADQGGTFRFAGVTDGSYRLRAQAEGYADSAEAPTVTVSGEPVTALEIVLRAGGTLTGQVLGLPPERLAGVTIQARGPSGRGRAALPDTAGGYRLESLGPGTWTVTAREPEAGAQVTETAEVAGDGRETRLDLEFGLGLRLSGQVLQAEAPLPGVRVEARGLGVLSYGSDEADTEGRFKFEGLEPGRYQVSVLDWSTSLSHAETLELESDREVVLRVPTARVRGRVVEAGSGDPVASAALSLQAEEGAGAGRSFGALSASDGSFTLERVGDGRYTLRAEREGFAAGIVPVSVALGRDPSEVKVTLERSEGLVLDLRYATGGIPATLQVAVLDASGAVTTWGSHRTGESGRVRLETVPAGFWTLILGAPGAAPLEIGLSAPGGPVPVTLPPACDLSVLIPELVGAAETASVSIEGLDGRPLRSLGWGGLQASWPALGGRLTLHFVPPGSWRVRAQGSGGRVFRGEATTAPGLPASVTLE